MKRMFGLMPSAEVTIEKSYKDRYDSVIKIQAGPNGWTIIWPDSSTWYKDITQDAEDNFKHAYQELQDQMAVLTEVDGYPELHEIKGEEGDKTVKGYQELAVEVNNFIRFASHVHIY